MSVDYEVEYNNRARVPDHPEIFVRWEREGADYRKASPKAALGLKYGPSERQTLDIFPAANDGPDTPLALFIHGGWWRSLHPSSFIQMAKGPNAHGVTIAVAATTFVRRCRSRQSSSRCARRVCSCGGNTRSASWSMAIPPAAI